MNALSTAVLVGDPLAREIQTLLNKLGYSVPPATGWTEETDRAVDAYYAAKGTPRPETHESILADLKATAAREGAAVVQQGVQQVQQGQAPQPEALPLWKRPVVIGGAVAGIALLYFLWRSGDETEPAAPAVPLSQALAEGVSGSNTCPRGNVLPKDFEGGKAVEPIGS